MSMKSSIISQHNERKVDLQTQHRRLGIGVIICKFQKLSKMVKKCRQLAFMVHMMYVVGSILEPTKMMKKPLVVLFGILYTQSAVLTTIYGSKMANISLENDLHACFFAYHLLLLCLTTMYCPWSPLW